MANPTKRVGSIEPVRDKRTAKPLFWPSGRPKYFARVRWPDGARPRKLIPEEFSYSDDRAREFARKMQEDIDAQSTSLLDVDAGAGNTSAPPAPETADQWFKRYLPTKECGATHRRITGNTWEKWVSPIIGPKPMASLTRDDVEDVRDHLDKALDAKQIRHSTARNVWGALTGALKAAYAARDRALRVHATPIHFGVLPPKRGASRQRPWLYPSEWTRVSKCAAVPIEWRQLYAIALYTGLRPGELRVLTWADVDLEARTISVSKAYERETRSVKPPKTVQGHRLVPIHERLLPLLEVLEGEADELVAPLLSVARRGEDRIAETFRAHLAASHVTRARLEADTATEEPVDFRSLRDSYATWSALAGVGDRVLQRRMGHASANTTDRYIKAAEALDPTTIGAPFPALPKAICVRRPLPVGHLSGSPHGQRRGIFVARVGFEAESRDATSTPPNACTTLDVSSPVAHVGRVPRKIAKRRRVTHWVTARPR